MIVQNEIHIESELIPVEEDNVMPCALTTSQISILPFSKNIKLISNDNKEFILSGKSAILSKLLYGVLQDFSDEISVPLIEINSITLEIVLNYLIKWNGVEPQKIIKPIKSCNMIDLTDEWSAKFIDNFSLEEIGDIALAANFMEIPSLVDLACAKIATFCYNKSEDELLKEFKIDPILFSEKEKKITRDENLDWLDDNPENFLI